MVYIPLMKELGMRWEDIKNTPRHELNGLLVGLREYQNYYSMDGYSAEEVSEMSKKKPRVRSQYHKYLETRRKYDTMMGLQKKAQSFRDIK
jgi:hypothetical protein